VHVHSWCRHTERVDALTRRDVLRRIVDRTDLDQFAERVLDSFWDRPEFQELHPSRNDVLAWVRWNLDLVIRWLIDGQAPTESELKVFRERARRQAADGTPAGIVPANFRRGARFAWGALLEAATEEERPALLESADLLFDYIDRVSAVFSDVYESAAKAAPIAPQETAARALLMRIGRDDLPLPEDHQLAEQIGFQLGQAARPFVIALPGWPTRDRTELAAALRRRRALAASEGRFVVGLANARSPWRGIELDSKVIIAQGAPAIRGERGRVIEQLRTAVDVALVRGDSGEIAVAEYLPELLLRRSPGVASQICARVYGPLDEAHPELSRTLDLLVEHSFERAPTAAAVPVHRNTLRDRIARISEITGVDLDSVRGRGLAWLAWLQRNDSSSGAPLETGT
jgi:PucR C-terminal helix-turn-helix domain